MTASQKVAGGGSGGGGSGDVDYSLLTLHVETAKPSTGGWRAWVEAPGSSLVTVLLAGILAPAGQHVVAVVVRVLRAVAALLLPLRSFWRPLRCPPPMDDPLLLHSATQLAALIREQKVTSVEAVAAYSRRVLAVNGAINTVVDERLEAAAEEAAAADAEVAAARASPGGLARLARRRPLLGVPLTVKESLAVQGLSHTSGQRAACGARATRDAEAVARMRAAGAVPLLVSNCPELCMHYESVNFVTGTTRNPHDPRRTAGGSSGGEAALLGAGASVIGLGSDIGGSLRLPAMFTGVFGHKPSAGLVSDVGHKPTSDDVDWWRLFTVGPMARYAEDLLLMMKIICKDEMLPSIKLDEKVKVSDLRIFYIDEVQSITSSPVKPEIRCAMQKAVNHLQKVCKVPPQKIYIEDLKHIFSLTAICLCRLQGITTIFENNECRSITMEWLKFMIGLSEFSFQAIIYGTMKEVFTHLSQDILLKYLGILGKIRNQFQEILKDNGVLLYPTFTKPAVFHGEMYICFPDAITYCSIFNILQMPATNCPLEKSIDGLPIGIQVAAAPYQDRLTIAVAQELQNAFQGYIGL